MPDVREDFSGVNVMTEISISREKARAILHSVGQDNDFDAFGDYYLVSWVNFQNMEALIQSGRSGLLTVNYSNVSWSSPGYPPNVD
jgi:hypothetical protein